MEELSVSNQPNQLLMNYKNHGSYNLFISSLRAEFTKIKTNFFKSQKQSSAYFHHTFHDNGKIQG